MGQESKAEVIARLQKDLLALQGLRLTQGCSAVDAALGTIVQAFPNKTFPIGAIHEFLSMSSEDMAATTGFISGLLGALMQRGGPCMWIGPTRTIFAPALKFFEIDPEKICFVQLEREKELLWAIEEALKCHSLAAVIGEVNDLSFTSSRRLQLATEKSQVTGFLLRHQPRKLNTTACMTRWHVMALSSDLPEGLPGVGYPRWEVTLDKVRSGRPGTWQVEWADGFFSPVQSAPVTESQTLIRKIG
ncbi:MAG: Error-prone repair protein ImuA [Chitinophagaceae bacterium]|nr:MAG: Error-prone repair protein ImuA [Chitinophagaceae bacterium]